MAAAYTSAIRAGKGFALVGVQAPVQRVLDICGVFGNVGHYDTEDEAAQG